MTWLMTSVIKLSKNCLKWFWDDFYGNYNCVRGTRTQPLICVGYSVHYWVSCAINKGGFFEIAFVVDTHLPCFEALAYVLPHFDALTHVVIRVSSSFIFQTFAEVCYSVFVNRSSFKSVLNLRKAYILVFSWYVMPCHDTKDSAGLHRFIPDSKTITINRHLFSFLYIAFYWNNNLSYVLVSQTQ